MLCSPAFGQTTAVDWDNEGVHLSAQGKYNEANAIAVKKLVCKREGSRRASATGWQKKKMKSAWPPRWPLLLL